MSPTEIARTAAFRLAVLLSLTFMLAGLLLFAFIYWQTAIYETRRIDGFLADEVAVLAREGDAVMLRRVEERVTTDLHRVSFAAVFDASGNRMAGNLATIPTGLAVDGQAHATVGADESAPELRGQELRAVARRLPNGRVLVIGRSVAELTELRETVIRALELGLAPVFVLSIGVGVLLSVRTLGHINRVHRTIEQIMQGDLHQRIPTSGRMDDLDRLTSSVNGMLDEIERLMSEVKGVGDDIAHDLRTPLTRLRARLERATLAARTQADLEAVIDRAIADLDQVFAIITALLRIGEIESGRRRAGFALVSLHAIGQEVFNLYGPIAEVKQVTLTLDSTGDALIHGDRDLLMEAVANLVDNAIKFVQPGGTVAIIARAELPHPFVTVRDDGPGIPEEQRSLVLRRFYRSDQSRHIKGNGLGLSLVHAIVRLHGFALVIADAQPGCVVTIACESRNALAGLAA